LETVLLSRVIFSKNLEAKQIKKKNFIQLKTRMQLKQQYKKDFIAIKKLPLRSIKETSGDEQWLLI
jgi:hypothetical protein